MRAAIFLVAMTAVAAAQDVCEPAPTPAPTAREADDSASPPPRPPVVAAAPLGEATVADESLRAHGLYGLDLRVEQRRRGRAAAVDTQVFPALLDLDGADAATSGLRYVDSGRAIPDLTATVALGDDLVLETRMAGVDVVSVRASHRPGASRQRWEVVPSELHWRVLRDDEVVGNPVSFDLATGTGALPTADVAAWTVALGGDASAPDALRAYAIDETLDDGTTTLTLWRRPDARTPTLLAACHVGTVVPRVWLDVAGPTRELLDVVVADVRVVFGGDAAPREVVTLVAASATWFGADGATTAGPGEP